ncbi:NYN domain-containing protein [Falsiroseomonas sp.]|uniref:NYN domain-containing protein n=1 Tax=Falsiroseomonas sp. TaxID=2870721 RepID=UPI003563F24F
MPEPAPPRRAALYVDFDNVFISLVHWDERAAYAFGERPDAWLAWLEGREGNGLPTERRTLIRRCYLNPGGFFDFHPGRAVARYRAARDLRNRTYFSEFRAAFVQAGFDVVDCPPVAYLKNTADMKMALDIREALDHPTRFDEFVLLSGDSDFLPALARLRAHDRRVTILAQENARRAYLAAADVVVGLEDFADRGMGNLPIAQAQAAPPQEQQAPPRAVPRPEPKADAASLRANALAWLREAVAASASGALRLTEVGTAIGRAFPSLRQTSYAGAGSLLALIQEGRDPRLAVTGTPPRLWVFDPERGPPPGDLPPGVEEQPDTGAAAEQDIEAPEEPAAEPPPPEQPMIEAPVPAEPAAVPPAPRPPVPDQPPMVEEAGPSAEELMSEAALLVRDLLWGSRDNRGLAQDLPAFSAAEIGFVLGAVADRLPFAPDETAEIAAGIAAAGAAQGHHVSAREVVAVIRWLLRGFAKLADPPPPDAALRLGRLLYATLVAAVRAVNEQLSDSEKEALREWALHVATGAAQGTDQAAETAVAPQ